MLNLQTIMNRLIKLYMQNIIYQKASRRYCVANLMLSLSHKNCDDNGAIWPIVTSSKWSSKSPKAWCRWSVWTTFRARLGASIEASWNSDFGVKAKLLSGCGLHDEPSEGTYGWITFITIVLTTYGMKPYNKCGSSRAEEFTVNLWMENGTQHR